MALDGFGFFAIPFGETFFHMLCSYISFAFKYVVLSIPDVGKLRAFYGCIPLTKRYFPLFCKITCSTLYHQFVIRNIFIQNK